MTPTPTTVSAVSPVREFATLREANVARQRDWCPDQLPDLSFRGNELAGETGEVCNVIKKLERERLGWRGSRDTIDHLAEELGDVVICADLIAISAGIDLDAAVEAKFNATSENVGLPHRLSRRFLDTADGVEPFGWVDANSGCFYSHPIKDADGLTPVFLASRTPNTEMVVKALYGPYGWLNGHRGLSEDSWNLETDPLENNDEYFAIPLYAKVDPFVEVGIPVASRSSRNTEGVVKAEPDAWRWRAKGADFWEAWTWINQDPTWLPRERFDVEPLYASPPSPAEVTEARPLDEWHEDMGDVLWWCYRNGAWLGEAPYVGSPLDLGQTVEIELRSHQGEFVHQHNVGGWPGYHTHWTPLPSRPPLQLNKKG